MPEGVQENPAAVIEPMSLHQIPCMTYRMIFQISRRCADQRFPDRQGTHHTVPLFGNRNSTYRDVCLLMQVGHTITFQKHQPNLWATLTQHEDDLLQWRRFTVARWKADTYFTFGLSLQDAHVSLDGIMPVEKLLCVVLQAPPFLGGSQTPRGTREQLDPVMPFQLAHHLADRAGRHSKLRSSGAHAALAQDDAKNIDRFE